MQCPDYYDNSLKDTYVLTYKTQCTTCNTDVRLSQCQEDEKPNFERSSSQDNIHADFFVISHTSEAIQLPKDSKHQKRADTKNLAAVSYTFTSSCYKEQHFRPAATHTCECRQC